MPQRIQRKRTKGWRMPQGAVFVGRPTRWGNPFIVQDGLMFGAMDDVYAGWCLHFHTHEEARRAAIDLYRDIVNGFWDPSKVDRLTDQEYQTLHRDLQAWRKRIGGHPLEVARNELSGHDLCCWCSPTQSCHADVLLELANQRPPCTCHHARADHYLDGPCAHRSPPTMQPCICTQYRTETP